MSSWISSNSSQRRRQQEDEDDDEDDEINVLVCTGNLGNAQPDLGSLAAWVPADGRCLDVLKLPQRYPVRTRVAAAAAAAAAADGADAGDCDPPPPFDEGKYDDMDQFDIIVLGMQEATFDPPDLGGNGGANRKNLPKRSSSVASSRHGDSSNTATSGPFASAHGSALEGAEGGRNSVAKLQPGAAAGGEVKSQLVVETVDTDDEIVVDGANAESESGQTKQQVLQLQEGFESSLAESERGSVDGASSLRGDSQHLHFRIPVVSPIHDVVSKGIKNINRNVGGLTANRDYTKSKPRSVGSMVAFSLDIDRKDWDSGTAYLHSILDARLPSYSRIVSFRRGEMRLEVYVREPEVATLDVKVLRVAAQNTGRAGLANKGGIVTELLVNDRTRLAFCTCHLEAHEGYSKYQMRCSSTATILNGTRSAKHLHDVSLSSHYAFWMGDLNFRTEMPEEEYEDEKDHKAKVRKLTEERNWKALNDIDELHRALRNKDCLVGFQTLFCNFPPTFKVERQAGFEYIDKRRPSYTDRVLWKNGHQLSPAKPLVYESVDDYVASDHKPVRAAFAVPLNKPLRMRPRLTRPNHRRGVHLSGLFSRRSFVKRNNKLRGSSSHRLARGADPSKKANAAAMKNKLYLFVSNMRCSIAVNANGTPRHLSSTYSPSPFVTLITFPEEAVKQPVKFWTKVKSTVFRSHIASKQRSDGSMELTALGWPRSSVRRATYEPNWESEEIPVKVNTHDKNGKPIDLTGSMLKISVVDHDTTTTVRVGTDDPLIGTFVFNLANLLRRCIRRDGCAEDPSSSRRADDPSQSNSKGGELRPTSVARGGMNRGSLSSRSASLRTSSRFLLPNVFGRKPTGEDDKDSDEDDDPIVSADIDEPLLKNGKEVGRIQCTIDAWWVNQDTARSLAAVPIAHGLAQTSINSNSDNGSGRVLLSARHQTPQQRKMSQQHGNFASGAESEPRIMSWMTG